MKILEDAPMEWIIEQSEYVAGHSRDKKSRVFLAQQTDVLQSMAAPRTSKLVSKQLTNIGPDMSCNSISCCLLRSPPADLILDVHRICFLPIDGVNDDLLGGVGLQCRRIPTESASRSCCVAATRHPILAIQRRQAEPGERIISRHYQVQLTFGCVNAAP